MRFQFAVATVAVLAGSCVPLAAVETARADTGTPPAFVASLGGPGHADVYPGGLEVVPDGSGIVVADTGNDRVVKYSLSGSVLWSVGTLGSGTGQFTDPRDIGIDPVTGQIYVADNSNGRIVILNSSGGWVKTFNGPPSDKMGAPIGVTVSGANVYVADGVQQKLRVFNTNGQQTAAYGSNGSCTLSRIRDAAADSFGNIYIANYLNNDIIELSSTGTCIKTWGVKGTGNGQFKNPYGVAVGTDPFINGGSPGQAVYVADSNNQRVQEFTASSGAGTTDAGTFVTSIGSNGTKPGTFTQLRRVAVDASGNVWAADLWGYRVEEFTRTSSGYTYALTIGGVPPPLTSDHAFNQPHQVAFDSSGNLEVVDTVNQRFVQMTAMGGILGACGQRGFQAGQENWPRGVAVDTTSGNLWIADTKQSNIQVLQPGTCTSGGSFGSIGTGPSNFDWPYSIAIRQGDRTAWIADTLNNRIVSYMVSNRTVIAPFGSLGSGSGQFNKPAGIAVSPTSGHILVADQLNNRVVELSDTGGSSVTVVRTLTDGFNQPQGVAADSAGRIYVADTGNSRVVVLNPDGTEKATITTSNGMALNQPASVSVDNSNSLYISDTNNDRVLVYSYGSSSNHIPQYQKVLEGPGTADMYPVDVTSDSNYYYAMDAGRYRIVVVNRTDGSIALATPGGQGSGPGQFGDARAIELDSGGNVYVADTPNNRVEEFYPMSAAPGTQLTFEGQFGSGGTGAGQFTQAYGVAVGPGIDDRNSQPAEIIYAVDGGQGGNGRVEKWIKNTDGTFTYLNHDFGAGQLLDPRQVTVDPVSYAGVGNEVFVMNARKHECDVFDNQGNFLFKFGDNTLFSDDPRGIAVSADGTLAFATDSGGKQIRVFALTQNSGSYLYTLAGPGSGPGQLTGPRGLTTTSDNHLVVSDEWGFGLHEYSFTPGTNTWTSTRDLYPGSPPIAPPVPGVNSPRGVHIDTNGRIWIDDWWNQRIDSINPDGSTPGAFGQRGTASQLGSVNFAWDFAIQPTTGWIYLANRESHQVQVFQPHADGTATPLTSWGTRGSADCSASGQNHNAPQMTFPQGITFAPDGTLLLADTGNGRIQRFSLDSNGMPTCLAAYGSPGSGVGQLNVPTGIATAADGTIWVADTLNNRIQSMSTSGTWTAYTAPGGTHFRAPWGVSVAPDGNVWASDTGNNRVVKLTSTGSFVFSATNVDMGIPGAPINPFSIAFGQNNHVYISDVWGNRVIDLLNS